MKKLTILTALILTSFAGMAQAKVTKDASGNYVTVKRGVDSSKLTPVALFTDAKGNVYPVYKSVNNKLFYKKTAVKSGNVYRVYIKED